MNLIKMKCDSCGATLEVNSKIDRIHCNYCGAETLIDDEASNLKRIEEAKLQARKDNHEQDMLERNDKLAQDLKEKELLSNSKEGFKKSKFSKVLLVFFAISVMCFFVGEGTYIKLLTLIQSGVFLIAWLMGMKIIKEPFNGLKTVLAIIGFVLIIPIGNSDGISSDYSIEYDRLNWNYIILKDHLPEPSENKVVINSNSDDYLSIDLKTTGEDGYRKYIEKCKKYGYTIDAKNETSSYEALNNDNYKIMISFDKTKNEYSISLELNDIEEESTSLTTKKVK